jgi:hypothetical protein
VTGRRPGDGPARVLLAGSREHLIDLSLQCIPPPEGAWDNGNGYYRLPGDKQYAHRAAYEAEVGPIPPGFTIDHHCRNHWCRQVHHLEAVTGVENTMRGDSPPAINARKDKCSEGHDYAFRSNGRRYCPTCRLRWRQEHGEISARGRKVDRTHCPADHEYTPENTYTNKHGHRQCRKCNTDRARVRRQAKQGRAA